MRLLQLAVAAILSAALTGPAAAATSAVQTAGATTQQVHGVIVAVEGNVLTLRLRNGKLENVDIAAAKAAQHTGVLPVGHAVVVYGSRDESGTFHAVSVGHTSPLSQDWSPDN